MNVPKFERTTPWRAATHAQLEGFKHYGPIGGGVGFAAYKESQKPDYELSAFVEGSISAKLPNYLHVARLSPTYSIFSKVMFAGRLAGVVTVDARTYRAGKFRPTLEVSAGLATTLLREVNFDLLDDLQSEGAAQGSQLALVARTLGKVQHAGSSGHVVRKPLDFIVEAENSAGVEIAWNIHVKDEMEVRVFFDTALTFPLDLGVLSKRWKVSVSISGSVRHMMVATFRISPPDDDIERFNLWLLSQQVSPEPAFQRDFPPEEELEPAAARVLQESQAPARSLPQPEPLLKPAAQPLRAELEELLVRRLGPLKIPGF
jgi:hypothetical protein